MRRVPTLSLAIALALILPPSLAEAQEEAPPQIDVRAAPTPFSPNGDGRRDATRIVIVVSVPAEVAVAVTDPAGGVWAEWLASLDEAGTVDMTWDGSGPEGPAPDGRYLVGATATIDPDTVLTDAAPAIVDTRRPIMRRLRVTPDPLTSGRAATLHFVARDPTSLEAVVTIRDAVSRVDRFTKPVSNGAVRSPWRPRYASGGRLLPGNYLISARVRDAAANVSRTASVPWRVHRPMPGHIYHALPAGRRVALTFDDCSNGGAWARILGVLRNHRAGGSFFCPGTTVLARPDLARRTVRAGHTPGSHAWDHANLTGRDEAFTLARVRADARAWWAAARATSAPYLRPPYGACDACVVRAAGRAGHPRVILWSVDPRDWQSPGAGTIAARVVSATQPGGIVVLHTKDQTAAALPSIIAGLRRRGLEPVTLAELFAAAGMR